MVFKFNILVYFQIKLKLYLFILNKKNFNYKENWERKPLRDDWINEKSWWYSFLNIYIYSFLVS